MIKQGYLKLRDGSELYWEAAGNSNGKPVVYLHGGPGGGSSTGHRKHFDLNKYYVITFDQRGCGRSRPTVSLENLSSNTTANLIEDIEELREFLSIEKWSILGISWGTCLALTYAQAHPSKVEKLVLAAIHLPTQEVVHWITEKLELVYPEQWHNFTDKIKYNETQSVIDYCYQQITSTDLNTRESLAKAWCEWEDVHMSLDPKYLPFDRFNEPEFRIIFATLVIHYWKHFGFINENEFFNNLNKISHIPTVMIHGNLDISSPMKIAWKISKALKSSTLTIIDDEGHGGKKMSNEITKAFSINE